jgi:hypothetical protein
MNILFLILIATATAGCGVSQKELRQRMDAAVYNAKVQCAAENAAKDERLRKFNQLNDDGTLRIRGSEGQ